MKGLAPLLKRAVQCTLDLEKVEVPCSVEVLYTDNSGIRKLNCEFRNLDRETDVLSFPLLDLTPGEGPQKNSITWDPDTQSVPLGTVVLSLEQAKIQAEKFGHSAEREAAYLCVHSVLHLLGYDHERSEKEDLIQREKTDRVMEEMKLWRS